MNRKDMGDGLVQISPSAEDIKKALLICKEFSPSEQWPCRKCYLFPFAPDGMMSTGRPCYEHMAQDACQLIDRLNDFDQSNSKVILEKCQGAFAQLTETERQLSTAVENEGRMAKAFALLCRMLDDFAGVPPCHVRQIDWPECNGESEQCGDRPIWQCWQKYILEQVDAEPVCRVCGCTEGNACQGGCYWVEPDLCSACAQPGGDSNA